jgi:hypothetical protein
MNDLLAPMTDEQQQLLDIVWEVFRGDGRWPIYQYVEASADKVGLDATAVLASFPRVSGNGRYSAIWFDGPPSAPTVDRQVAITIAGLRSIDEATDLVAMYLKVLNYLVRKRRSAVFAPMEMTVVRVTRGEILTDVRGLHGIEIPSQMIDAIYELMEHEPPTRGGSRARPDVGGWWRETTRDLLRFHGVSDVEDYLRRTVAFLTPPPPRPAVKDQPPLALPASLDFFDTV